MTASNHADRDNVGGRQLGAFERTVDLYMQRNPVQFSLVGELHRPITLDQLQQALVQLQRTHPLLATRIDRSSKLPAFVPVPHPIPISVVAKDTPWQTVAMREQQQPIRSQAGPLARATLIPKSGDRCSVVITFAHQIADGVGGLQALNDLVRLLAGEQVTPTELPAAMEDLIGDAGPADIGPEAPRPRPDARLDVPGEIVPFAGSAPHIDAVSLHPEWTGQLRNRCRQETTTVHAALCAAAIVVLGQHDRDFIRVLSPIDLRRAADLPPEVAVRFTGARTGSPAFGIADFWDAARRIRIDLDRHRRPTAIGASTRMLASQPPTTSDQAEDMITTGNAADIQISNLGAITAHPQLAAVWGPVQITQLRDEHILTAVTSHGQLRLTETTHEPIAGLLADISATLAMVCWPVD